MFHAMVIHIQERGRDLCFREHSKYFAEFSIEILVSLEKQCLDSRIVQMRLWTAVELLAIVILAMIIVVVDYYSGHAK
jgi:hypothetical protein